MWKKPVTVIYDIESVQKAITAKAYTVGQVNTMETLMQQGVGAAGSVGDNANVIGYAIIVSIDAITGWVEFLWNNSVMRLYNKFTKQWA